MLIAAVLLPLLAITSVNIFLNTGLRPLVNLKPERARIEWGRAWMLVPGEVEVWDLDIRVQDLAAQWQLTANHATGTIDLWALTERRFSAHTLRGEGAAFRLRALDSAAPGSDAASPAVPGPIHDSPLVVGAVPQGDMTPPIEGWTNPPDPTPEALYGPPDRPFRVQLDDLVVEHVREIWVEDYHFLGDARVTGGLDLLKDTTLEVRDTHVEIDSGNLRIGDVPLADALHGAVVLGIDRTDLSDPNGPGLLEHLSARVTLTAQIQDLHFLDFYLREASWLAVDGGKGPLDLDVTLEHGRFMDGSRLAIDAPEIGVRFLSYAVKGGGKVRLLAGPIAGVSVGQLTLEFLDYSITKWGDTAPHVKGTGLRVSANTPDLTILEPFKTLAVAIELPDSTIPDAAVYNDYLPKGLGFSLRKGVGRAHGHLFASTADDSASGELYLDAKGMQASLDKVRFAGDVSLFIHLAKGQLSAGRYDISGSRLKVDHLSVVDAPNARKGKDDSWSWWADLAIPNGQVAMGAPVFLDASLKVKFRDTVPFVTLFAQKKPLPGWIRGVLNVKGMSGNARVLLGDDTLSLPTFALRGGPLDLKMALRRHRSAYLGKLYVRYGVLQVAVELLADQSKVHLIRPSDWYAAQAAP